MKINTQPREGYADSDHGELQVNSIFDTIQGEGPFSGTPATFIRLAGCNLQCSWCDTEYTDREQILIEDIVSRVTHKLVVLTGGEPTRQNIVPLINALELAGHMVQLETNGTLWREGLQFTHAVIVISPKTDHIHDKYSSLDLITYIKVIIGHGDYPSQGRKGGYVVGHYIANFILPLDTGNKEDNKKNYDLAVTYVKSHPECKLQVQLHKIVGLD